MLLKVEKDNVKHTLVEEKLHWIGHTLFNHEDQTFYRSFAYNATEFVLGDVHYIRHLEDPNRMSFVEIYMLWELQHTKYMSARVYYFPEDTCAGKLEDQGQDEVICLCGEVVLRCNEFVEHLEYTANEAKDLPKLKILSFSAYCRYAAMKRRLGDKIEEYSSHPLFKAMGGLDPAYRVLYCRDTVNDRSVERVWRVQPSYRVPATIDPIKGPSRKRTKYTHNSSTHNSNQDTHNSSPHNSSQDAHNSSTNNNDPGAVSTGLPDRDSVNQEDSCSDSCGSNADQTSDKFTSDLRCFLRQQGIRLNKVPTIACRQVNMKELYDCVTRHGGYQGVSRNRMWRRVFLETGGKAEYTCAATTTRKLYQRYLLPYELKDKGTESETGNSEVYTGNSSVVQSISKSSENTEVDIEGDVQDNINNGVNINNVSTLPISGHLTSNDVSHANHVNQAGQFVAGNNYTLSQRQNLQKTTWVPSSLLSNITDIKLPFNFISSQATPEQLDHLIKQLSDQIARESSNKTLNLSSLYLQSNIPYSFPQSLNGNIPQAALSQIQLNSIQTAASTGFHHLQNQHTRSAENKFKSVHSGPNDILNSLTREQLLDLISKTGL